MICNRCGTEFDDVSGRCPVCGNENVSAQQDAYQQAPQQPYDAYQQAPQQPQQPYGGYQAQQPQQPYGGYQAPQQPYGSYQQPYGGGYQQPMNQNEMMTAQEINSARTMGIVAIVCALLGLQIVSYICGGLGISKMNGILQLNPANQAALEAKKLCKIGIIIAIVITAVAVIAYAAMFAIGASGGF